MSALAEHLHLAGAQAPAAGPLRLRLMEEHDSRRWDAYVDQCPQATFFHRAGWQRVLRQAFGHRTWFYYCLLYTSPSPRDGLLSRMPSSA